MPSFFLTTCCFNTVSDIISIQPASSPPVASHKGALGALVVDPSHAMDHATMPPGLNLPPESDIDRQLPRANMQWAFENKGKRMN
ncbi:hypothetical protein NQZ68_027621 [Dissostichus eleginoides]|nr:hypothetical protein NQZ68_027621 [Dissostichus eleginoides]